VEQPFRRTTLKGFDHVFTITMNGIRYYVNPYPQSRFTTAIKTELLYLLLVYLINPRRDPVVIALIPHRLTLPQGKVAFDVPGERKVHFKISLLTCSRRGRRLPPGSDV